MSSGVTAFGFPSEPERKVEDPAEGSARPYAGVLPDFRADFPPRSGDLSREVGLKERWLAHCQFGRQGRFL